MRSVYAVCGIAILGAVAAGCASSWDIRFRAQEGPKTVEITRKWLACASAVCSDAVDKVRAGKYKETTNALASGPGDLGPRLWDRAIVQEMMGNWVDATLRFDDALKVTDLRKLPPEAVPLYEAERQFALAHANAAPASTFPRIVTSWAPWTALLALSNPGAGSHALEYLCCAAGAIGLAWWGIQESRPERINLAIAGFALTVLCFYFSDVMDKIGRSASLILMGLLFLGGGWLLERTRRGLLARMNSPEAL